ncbi:hypothetical protein D3C87_621470 [compost metagenome]
MIEELPRITTFVEPPVPPELFVTATPAILPAIVLITLASFTRVNSSPLSS